MTVSFTLEGDVSAADTEVQLTTQGSVSSPALTLPSGFRVIKTIIASIGIDHAAAGSAIFLLRLRGTGIKNGEQVLTLAAAGGQAAQSGGDPSGQSMAPIIINDVDIEITPPDSVTIAVESAGSDLGDAGIAITLILA